MHTLGWLLVYICILTEIHSLKYSFTVDSNKLCMTDCVPYKDYKYCYLGWGSSNWDYCTPGSVSALQYYTSMNKGNLPKCTSLCGKFGYDYNWCLTGESGEWDYCITELGKSSSSTCMKPCQKNGETYQCVTGLVEEPPSMMIDYPGFDWHKESWDNCAPPPVNIEELKEIGKVIVSRPGEFSRLGYRKLEHCIRNKRISSNVVRHVGVDALATRYERMYPSTQLAASPQVAVTSYTAMQAPPLGRQYPELLTLVVRATIYRRHLNNRREAIPDFITERMRNMNALPNDERGHLLAASLGGPTQQFNFAPQSSRVNRASGGDSYWFNIEGYLRDFLQHNSNGRVEWVLIIGYGNLEESRRPTGFGLRFRQYDGNNVLVNDSGDCYFTNGANDACEII